MFNIVIPWRGNLLAEEIRFTFPRDYFISSSAIVTRGGLHGAALPSNIRAQEWEGDYRVQSNLSRMFQSLKEKAGVFTKEAG